MLIYPFHKNGLKAEMLLYNFCFCENLFLNCKSCNFMAQYSVTIDIVQPPLTLFILLVQLLKWVINCLKFILKILQIPCKVNKIPSFIFVICDSDLIAFKSDDSRQLTVGEDYRHKLKKKKSCKVYGIWLTNRMDHFYDILIVLWHFETLKLFQYIPHGTERLSE